jgi:hypothetical protein
MVTIAVRADNLQRTMEALLAGGSGWPYGVIDVARKRLEVAIDVLWMSDKELAELSAEYQALLDRPLGPTSVALMIEIARRSTLSGHERMAEARERMGPR